MAHTVDSETGLKIRATDAVEKQKQDVLKYIAEERSHLVYLEDKLIDPTNETKQLGNALFSDEIERRLKTVLPSTLAFIDNPFNQTKRAIVKVLNRNDPNFGAYETIVPYEKGYTPEHSVMQLVEEEMPDPDVISRKKSISRKDFGKTEYIPGHGFQYVNRPGFVKNKKIGREVKRGWRTILIKLILAGYLTIADAEKLFGNDNSPGWQQHLGKTRTPIVPW